MSAPPISQQPKPRRLPPQAPTNPALAAALAAQAQKSTPTASPANPSTGTPTAPGGTGTPAGSAATAVGGASATPTGGQQSTPADGAAPGSTPAGAPAAGGGEPAPSVPESAPTVQTVTDHPTSEHVPLPGSVGDLHMDVDGLHGERKVWLEEEVQRLGTAFKSTALRAGDVMRFQAHIRRLNVNVFVRRVPYALSSSLAREVERFDEACDEIEAALLKAYGLISAEIQRRRALEAAAAALSPPSARISSRAATSPPSMLPGSLQPSQPASPRPATSHSHAHSDRERERPHPPPLNTRLSDSYPQRPSALPRPSAVHLSALPNASLSGLPPSSNPTSTASAIPGDQPPPSRHNPSNLSLDLASTRTFTLQPSLVSPVTLAPKRPPGTRQSPLPNPAALLPPELLSALQGVDLSTLQAMQNLSGLSNLQALGDMQTLQALQNAQQQQQGQQMSPQGGMLQLQMSPGHGLQPLLPEGMGLMSPAHIGGDGVEAMGGGQAGEAGGTGTGIGGERAAGPSAIDGMDIDFLDVPGPVRPLVPTGGEMGQGVAAEEGKKAGEGAEGMGDLFGPPAQGDGSQPGGGGATDGAGDGPKADGADGQQQTDMGGMGMDFHIPGLEDTDFLSTFNKPASPSSLSHPGAEGAGAEGGVGEGMDFDFDLGELPELNFAGLGGEGQGDGDGGLDFASMGDMSGLGGMGGMSMNGLGMNMGGAEGVGEGGGLGDMDFGAMGMDMDFGELGSMLGGPSASAEAGGGEQPEGAQKPAAPSNRTMNGAGAKGKGVMGGDGGMDEDGRIDLDGGLDLDELFKNFGGDDVDEE